MGIRTAARGWRAESRVGAQSEVELPRLNAKRGGNLLARRFAQTLAAFLLRVRRLGDADTGRDIGLGQSEMFAPGSRGRRAFDRAPNHGMRNQTPFLGMASDVVLSSSTWPLARPECA